MRAEDFYILIVAALNAPDAYAGYTPRPVVYVGARKENTKRYALQVVPDSLQEETLSNGATAASAVYMRRLYISVTGIYKTNKDALILPNGSFKGLLPYMEDTMSALNKINDILPKDPDRISVSFDRADLNYDLYPDVLFNITATCKYKYRY
jgi:hypothetical protein